MISAASLGLAAYQALAVLIGLPRVSRLSRRFPWGVLVWGWWLWLGLHFLKEAHRE